MRVQNLDHMFHGLTFQKKADEIVSKASDKVVIIKTKIEERISRVKHLREEYGIDDTALIQLLTEARKLAQSPQHDKMSYSFTNIVGGTAENKMEEKIVGAGVVNNLLTENDFIEAEREQVTKLELIIRNLKPLHNNADNGTEYVSPFFELTYEELKFLGF